MDELSAQSAEISKGNLTRPEAMLMNQAHTLEALFSDLTLLAYNHLNNFDVAERLLRLAFKAQGQARATVETLATLKSPATITFVRQANVTHGPQQVNNGSGLAADASRARKFENQPNELLEQQREKWLDDGATPATGSVDTTMATVGAIHRPADNERKEAK